MQDGAPLWEPAGYLGMSEKTLRGTYGHHHSDFMRGAVDAVGRKPPRREKLVETLADGKRNGRTGHSLKILVVDAVVVEPVSAANSLLTGKRTGIFRFVGVPGFDVPVSPSIIAGISRNSLLHGTENLAEGNRQFQLAFRKTLAHRFRGSW